MTGKRGPEAGSASVEMAVFFPALMLVLALVVFAARLGQLHVAVDSAAANAARAASIERTPAAATASARESVDATLASEGLDCQSKSVRIDARDVAKPAGQSGLVRVDISCTTRTAPLPGSRTVTATATSAVDTYREAPR